MAYSPLGRGFLTGQFTHFEDFAEDDYRRNSPRFQGHNFQKNLELVARVKAIADRHGVTAGQLALAWVLAQGDDIVPIPGTKRRSYLEENIDANQVRLSAPGSCRNRRSHALGHSQWRALPGEHDENAQPLARRNASSRERGRAFFNKGPRYQV